MTDIATGASLEAGVRTFRNTLFLVVDVETTGLSERDEIVEIAVQPWAQHLGMLHAFSSLVRPQRRQSYASHVHGIDARELQRAPLRGLVVQRLALWLQELQRRYHLQHAVLVAHYAPFDRRFAGELLGDALRRAGVTRPLPWLCTCAMARELAPELESHALQSCVTHFIDDPPDGWKWHRAGSDAAMTTHLLCELATRFQLLDAPVERFVLEEGA